METGTLLHIRVVVSSVGSCGTSYECHMQAGCVCVCSRKWRLVLS